MATSDNVIRAGLTPKLRDVPNLVAGLTYQAAEPAKHMIQPASFHGASNTTLYDPPIPEFSVLLVDVKASEKETHPAIDGPSVAIVTEGYGRVQWGDADALEVRKGEVFFIGAGTELEFVSRGGDSFNVYRAFVDVQA